MSDLQRLYDMQFRPLMPGEQRNNPDGSYSTEISVGVTGPDGRVYNVPSLWRGHGGTMVELPADQALRSASMIAHMFGTPMASYPDPATADIAAEAASKAGGRSFAQMLINSISGTGARR